MQYKYGVVGKLKCNGGTFIKVPALVSLLKKEISQGKWNIYEGGDSRHPAKISFKGKSFEYGEHMFIYGSQREFEFFEKIIEDFIKVIPRKF